MRLNPHPSLDNQTDQYLWTEPWSREDFQGEIIYKYIFYDYFVKRIALFCKKLYDISSAFILPHCVCECTSLLSNEQKPLMCNMS